MAVGKRLRSRDNSPSLPNRSCFLISGRVEGLSFYDSCRLLFNAHHSDVGRYESQGRRTLLSETVKNEDELVAAVTCKTSNNGNDNWNFIPSPYFMHPNENPGNILATPLLSSPNYHSWSRVVTVALRSKHKLHFINGALPRPADDDQDSIAWDRYNTMLISWISDCTISTYYTRMKKLWQELNIFRPIPNSSCTDNCKALEKMRAYRDSDQVIRFLKGLNDQYAVVRSQIMLMESLPNICKIDLLLVQQEKQSLLVLEDSKLLAASSSNSNFSRGSPSSSQQSHRGGGGKSNVGRGREKP
ncbi:hypothetical protein TSUD_154820 [Trifolium subterraneum]|uniref:Retrotransposon Copia-like N-terminal domain-containing protein n=1 Tax=Trifolium subterraneum TaxID=3900 RepID=A0A2Z6M299_TRISU|nr:hypothetical protein TSUD_154820 [Trifolium subterraneum]